MTATVDTRSGTVRDGERQFRFTADCLAGTATLDCDGRRIGVRVLRWAEKSALARFASAGAAFLSAQLLQVCAGAAESDPECAAALALLLWLDAPDEPPLPMDARLLAQVTLDLCAALGTSVDDLARRPAAEVETLWRAMDRAATAPADDAADDGVTRIIVLPDEIGDAAAATPAPAAAIQPDTRHPAEAQMPTAEVTPSTEASPVLMPSAPEPPIRVDARRDDRPRFRVGLTPHVPGVRIAPRSEVAPIAPPNQAGSNSPAPSAEHPAAARAAPPEAASAAQPDHYPSGTIPLEAVTQAASPRTNLTRTARNFTSLQQPPLIRVPDANDTLPDLEPAAALARVIAAVSCRPASLPTNARSDEAVLDTFAERLEAAAETLGIAMVD